MTAEQLLQAADRLIAYADEIAPTDIPNFSAWRADYADYKRVVDAEQAKMDDYWSSAEAMMREAAGRG